MPSIHHLPSRQGGATSALLALVVLIAVVAAAVWFVPALRSAVFGVPASSSSTAAATQPAAADTPRRVGAVTAVRAKEGLPTFCLVDAGTAGVPVGTQLSLRRGEAVIATALVESVSDQSRTCRITAWQPGHTVIQVGDTATEP